MADIDFPCDGIQAFNFEADAQSPIGHLTSFKVGSDDTGKLAADLNVKKPTDKTVVAVVGVLNQIHWGGGLSDDISFSCQISTPNKQAVQGLLQGKLEDTTCTFGFIVYDYDPVAKKYFIALQGSATDNTPLNGLLKKSGKQLVWSVDAAPGPVQSPKNFGMAAQIVAQDQAEQGITYATADQKNIAKKWGTKVGAAG